MTTDDDLLPLPEEEWNVRYGYHADAMREYARANVAHATAAKDAEIEALRVEVAAQRTRADAMAGEAIKHKARAEPQSENTATEALEYIFGKTTLFDWRRVIDERLTPPWPLEHHARAMGLFKDKPPAEPQPGVDANELAGVRARLKSGDYDGTDIMRAWLAIDTLLAQQPAAEAQTAEKESDGEILSRLEDDAQKWAQEFRKTAIQLGYSDMEEGWLVGWFAAAIEHSSDTRRWRKEAQPPSAPVWVEGVRRYLAARDAKPMHGTDPDVIHTIHTGTEWEAELRVSDLRALTQQPAAVDEATRRDAERYRWLRENAGAWEVSRDTVEWTKCGTGEKFKPRVYFTAFGTGYGGMFLDDALDTAMAGANT